MNLLENVKQKRAAHDLAAEQLRVCREELVIAKDALAISLCHHRVGDVIDCGGYAHQGKKMFVDKITAAKYSSGDWLVIGRIMKKNGEPSNIYYEFSGVSE